VWFAGAASLILPALHELSLHEAVADARDTYDTAVRKLQSIRAQHDAELAAVNAKFRPLEDAQSARVAEALGC
jgi:hypothetical protein